MNKLILGLRIITALILLQTLYFKFSGAPESIYIFSTLGMEPWGRLGSGLGELIAGILILIPATQAIGALVSLGIITGAILSHIFVLGIEVQGDGGLLFGLAVTVFVCSAIIVVVRRFDLLNLISFIKNNMLRKKAS